MRTIIAIGLLTASIQSVSAQSVDELAQEVSRTAQGHMLITYVCREAIGDSWYQAARSISEGTMREFGLTSDEALLQVQEYEDRIKREIAARGPQWPFGDSAQQQRASACTAQVNDALTEARLAAARARQALGTAR